MIHSIGPSEILHMAKVLRVGIEESIRSCGGCGLDSIAGCAGRSCCQTGHRRAVAPPKESVPSSAGLR